MLSHKKPDSVINVKVEFGEGEGKVPLDNIAKRAEAYKLVCSKDFSFVTPFFTFYKTL